MMASRDIASMHLFLEMKRLFPELPEDLIRKTIHEWQDDHKKCLHYLRKEREKHRCPRQSFSEYLYTQREDARSCNSMNVDASSDSRSLDAAKSPFHSVSPPMNFSLRSSVKNAVHKGIERSEKMIFVNTDSHNRKKTHVVPIADAHKSQFLSVMYKNHVTPISHTLQSTSLPFKAQKNVTEKVSPISSDANFNYKTVHNTSSTPFAKEHKVTLSFIPSLSYQQKIIIPESSVSASASQKTGLGRHVTSIHLELQPDLPEKPAVKIVTSSDDSGPVTNKQKYDSCIHISFTSRGATFSAQRVANPGEMNAHQYKMSINSGVHKNVDQSKSPFVPPSTTQEQGSKRNISYYQTRTSCPVMPTQNSSSPAATKPQTNINEVNHMSRHSVYQKNQSQIGALTGSNHTSSCLENNIPNNYEKHLQQPQISPIKPPYVQAVIHHQKLRLEMLRKEFRNEKSLLHEISSEIKAIERLSCLKRTGHLSFSAEIAMLKMENNKLKEECRILSMALKRLEIAKGKQPAGS